MVVDLIDEVAIMAYFEGLKERIPDLNHVVNVDAASDPNKAISDYITNMPGSNATTGLMLFVSIHEGVTDLSLGKAGYEFAIMMNVVRKVADIKRSTMLEMRKNTRECLLNVVGCLVSDETETRQAKAEELKWELNRADERVVPTSEMGNAKVYGHNTGIEIYVDMGAIMFNNI
jgi:hypothetical protein